MWSSRVASPHNPMQRNERVSVRTPLKTQFRIRRAYACTRRRPLGWHCRFHTLSIHPCSKCTELTRMVSTSEETLHAQVGRGMVTYGRKR